MMAILEAHYFLTIVYDYSSAASVYLMSEKSEADQLLVDFCMMAKWQYEKFVKCVRSDNGQEFKWKQMLECYGREMMVH